MSSWLPCFGIDQDWVDYGFIYSCSNNISRWLHLCVFKVTLITLYYSYFYLRMRCIILNYNYCVTFKQTGFCLSRFLCLLYRSSGYYICHQHMLEFYRVEKYCASSLNTINCYHFHRIIYNGHNFSGNFYFFTVESLYILYIVISATFMIFSNFEFPEK